MNLKAYCYWLPLFQQPLNIFAQNRISGTVKDQENNKNLAEVSVYIADLKSRNHNGCETVIMKSKPETGNISFRDKFYRLWTNNQKITIAQRYGYGLCIKSR